MFASLDKARRESEESSNGGGTSQRSSTDSDDDANGKDDKDEEDDEEEEEEEEDEEEEEEEESLGREDECGDAGITFARASGDVGADASGRSSGDPPLSVSPLGSYSAMGCSANRSDDDVAAVIAGFVTRDVDEDDNDTPFIALKPLLCPVTSSSPRLPYTLP